MSTATILILVFAVAMIAMHLRGHGGQGGQGGHSGHDSHGAGHGGCGVGHASGAPSTSNTPTVRVADSGDPGADSNPRRGHEHG